MKIVFTSCTRYSKIHKQSEWNNILDKSPDHLFLLGDNIYMDYGIHFLKPYRRNFNYFKKRMDKMYNIQWSNPNFKNLVDIMTLNNGFHGIWDDHDCGWNNIRGGNLKTKDIKKIEYSKEKFFSKFPISKQKENIYYSYDQENIRFIFLDNRSYATDKEILGDTQFEFLENKLNNDKALTIVCGGITLSKGSENYKSHPFDYAKFCKITSESPSKVIYLSGDIHKNRFIAPDNGTLSIENQKPPFEIISSGISRGFERKHKWCMLDIDENNYITVSFYNRGKKQMKRSIKCTKKLNRYLQ